MALRAGQIARMRQIEGAFFEPAACVIRTKSAVASSTSTKGRETWTDGAALDCRIMPLPFRAIERVAGERQESEMLFRVSFATGTAVPETGRIVYRSELYEIVGGDETTSDEIAVHVLVRRIHTGG